MKYIHTFKLLLLSLSLLIVWNACEQYKAPVFDEKNAYTAIVPNQYSIVENSTKALPIPVAASGISHETVTVGFELTVDTESGYREAKEGVDYTVVNPTRQLTYPDGVGYDTIWIRPVDNSIKNGHSTFRIKLTGATLNYQVGFNGTENTYTDVLIYDDESMSKYEGSWLVSGNSAVYRTGTQEKATADTSANYTYAIPSYVATIVSHPTEENTLIVRNFMNEPTLSTKLIVDEENGKIWLPVGTGNLLGEINKHPIYLDSFSEEDTPSFSQPAEGFILDDDTLKVIRYAAIYDNATYGWIIVGAPYYVLKSTWTRIKVD